MLRLSPDAFWALTPREIATMAGARRPAAPMTRECLDELARRHPDLTSRNPDLE